MRKKLLATGCMAMSVAFWMANKMLVAHLLAILLVIVLNAINPSGVSIGFNTGTSIARDLVFFVTDFFEQGGVDTTELFLGL